MLPSGSSGPTGKLPAAPYWAHALLLRSLVHVLIDGMAQSGIACVTSAFDGGCCILARSCLPPNPALVDVYCILAHPSPMPPVLYPVLVLGSSSVCYNLAQAGSLPDLTHTYAVRHCILVWSGLLSVLVLDLAKFYMVSRMLRLLGVMIPQQYLEMFVEMYTFTSPLNKHCVRSCDEE